MKDRFALVSKPQRNDRISVRTVIDRTVLLACFLLIAAVWFLAPYRTIGNSMAPALLGPHAQVACPGCGALITCGYEGAASEGRSVVCPHCGAREAQLHATGAVAGDGLLVDRTAYLWRGPRRWEPVVLRSPADPSRTIVKRVAGLPGERIAVREGEVYINGQLCRKSLDEQRRLAIAVYDSATEDAAVGSEDSLPRPLVGSKSWKRAAPGTFHRAAAQPPSGEATDQIDWIAYQHSIPGTEPATLVPAPIRDVSPYNQSQPALTSDPVRDVMLVCHVRATGSGTLALRAEDGSHRFEVRIELAGGGATGTSQVTVTLTDDGQSIARASLGSSRLAVGAELVFSIVDQQVLLAIGGETIFEEPFAADLEAIPPPSPLAIGATGPLEVELEGLHVLRDVYYCQPPAPAAVDGLADGIDLADGQFFLLGDNSAVSLDCRHRGFGPAFEAKWLQGKPLVVHWATRRAQPLGWSIQVPALERFGYIR